MIVQTEKFTYFFEIIEDFLYVTYLDKDGVEVVNPYPLKLLKSFKTIDLMCKVKTDDDMVFLAFNFSERMGIFEYNEDYFIRPFKHGNNEVRIVLDY